MDTREAVLLLVEDDAELREALAELLSRGRWTILEAGDGVEALEVVRRSRPDVVLTDVNMPRMDGIELVRRLRADSATKNVPVLVHSSASGERAVTAAFDAGASDYLRKPCPESELTARLHTQLELARSRTAVLARTVTDTVDLGLVALDEEGRVEFANGAAERMLGWSQPELIGTPFKQRVSSDGMPTEAQVASWDDRFVARDGRTLLVSCTSRPIAPGPGSGVVVSFEEVTGRRRSEAAMRLLAIQLSEVEETSRRRLSHDLHDTIGQTLSVMKLNLERIRAGAEGLRPLLPRVEECLALSASLIEQVRELALELHPVMLEEFGLAAALRRDAERLAAKSGVKVSVSENGKPRTVGRTLMSYVYRCVRELLSNAVKHAKAREVVVMVHWHPERLRVVVDDDGMGFDIDRALTLEHRGGVGLASIRDRLSLLGGRLILESRPGEGTRAALEVVAK